ncbi:MAG: hypothetical protein WB697_12295 [Stellaceae bacterium]
MPPRKVLMPRRARSACLEARVIALAALLLLAGCHGGTLDAIYPGTLGHDPPPAVNLPPQDAGMGMTVRQEPQPQR